MSWGKIPAGLVESVRRLQLITPFLEDAEEAATLPTVQLGDGERTDLGTCQSSTSPTEKAEVAVDGHKEDKDFNPVDLLERPKSCEKRSKECIMVTQADEEEDPSKFALARRVTWTREVIKYRVLSAISPFEFYAIEEADKDSYFGFSGGYDLLQQVARDTKLHSEANRLGKLVKNMMYTTYDVRTCSWNRCRLLDIDEETGTAVVYYFDYYLEKEKVAIESLREIPKELAVHPIVPTYKCHLYDVIPMDGSFQWDDSSNEIFLRQLFRQNRTVWLGLQMSFDEQRVANDADILVSVGMILFEDTNDPWEGISINWRLVRCKKAQAVGVGGTYFTNLFFPDAEPMFSLEAAPIPIFPPWMTQLFPYEAGSRLPQVSFAAVRGLDCIYVTLVNKYRDLKAMEHFMKTNPSPKMSRELVKFGTPVLCVERVQEEDGIALIKRSRGIVLKIFPGAVVSVLQVDSGTMVKLPIDNLYEMPARLVKIPAFAHRIHLKNIRPKRSSSESMLKWYSDTRENLIQFLQSFSVNLNPALFVFRENPNLNKDIVALNELHQPLVYNSSERKWMLDNTGRHHHVSLKSMPLVESYFYSFGVEVKVTCNRNGNTDLAEKHDLWRFIPLSVFITETDKFNAELVSEQDAFAKKEYYNELAKKTQRL